jgi:hypothetical protein
MPQAKVVIPSQVVIASLIASLLNGRGTGARAVVSMVYRSVCSIIIGQNRDVVDQMSGQREVPPQRVGRLQGSHLISQAASGEVVMDAAAGAPG